MTKDVISYLYNFYSKGSPFSKDFIMGKSKMVLFKKDFKKELTLAFLQNLVNLYLLIILLDVLSS